jgi:uncharacterized BrkB/YihY/UPF0761 family membrane protein
MRYYHRLTPNTGVSVGPLGMVVYLMLWIAAIVVVVTVGAVVLLAMGLIALASFAVRKIRTG